MVDSAAGTCIKELYSLIVSKWVPDILHLRAFFIIMKNLKGVYIIGEYHKYEDSIIFKVGKSSNILAWLKAIQKGNPRRLELIAVLKHQNPAALEDDLLNLLDDYAFLDGWFQISKDIIEFYRHDYPEFYDSLLDFYEYCKGSPFLNWEHKTILWIG